MSKDYYKILGVTKDAKEDEIKKAFKKQAKKYHPDVSKEENAEEKFKEVNEAFEVLSNPDKKNKYDKYGDPDYEHNPFQGRGGGFNPFDGFGNFGNFKVRTPQEQIPVIELRVPMSIYESFHGCQKEIDFMKKDKCKTCDGKGHGEKGSSSVCSSCNGAGKRVFNNGIFGMVEQCKICKGSGKIIKNPCKSCGGERWSLERTKLSINLPKGATTGNIFTVKGVGHWQPNLNIYGHLNVHVHTLPDDFFKVEREDVRCRVPITIKEAVFGGSIEVPSFHGMIKIKVPKQTQSETTFKVKGKGFRLGPNSNEFGNMFVTVFVEIPAVDPKNSNQINQDGFEYKKVSDFTEKAKDLSEKVKKVK
jgi:molecular chaperone DnaJ